MEYVELMNKFLFITNITPVKKRTQLRMGLNDCYKNGLLRQTYGNWKVIVLGEGERIDERFHVFPLIDGTRQEKEDELRALYASEEIRTLVDEADYVIKLDDDDVISPTLLSSLANFSGAAYIDEFHTFYDLSSGLVGQQKRPWFAATCVHRKEHAFSKWLGDGASSLGTVLYSVHSKAWYQYYAENDLNVVKAPKSDPIYLRILSPTSRTAGGSGKAINTSDDIDWKSYWQYMSEFGDWKAPVPIGFEDAVEELKQVWLKFADDFVDPKLGSSGLFRRLAKKLLR